MHSDAIEDLEIRLLLQAIREVYGHDFRDYAEASLKRRLQNWLRTTSFSSFSEAQAKIVRDPATLDSLVQNITVNVTEMFRDPDFFHALRERVLPFLKTYPFVKIWHAGCATGEEAYSLAIMLHEMGMQGRFRLYATDINEAALQTAKDGVFPLNAMQAYTKNYQMSGGSAAFSDYYTANYGHAMFRADLKDAVIFAPHNLAVDSDFGEMHLILCRNVMIYFKPSLKERCLALFDRCLLAGHYLCLGTKESLSGRAIEKNYIKIGERLSIYQKRYE